jgi:hypothetical protein
MPQPHEQKLQAVVYSFVPLSFALFAAAWTSLGFSPSDVRARPAPPPAVSFNQLLLPRLILSRSVRVKVDNSNGLGTQQAACQIATIRLGARTARQPAAAAVWREICADCRASGPLRDSGRETIVTVRRDM